MENTNVTADTTKEEATVDSTVDTTALSTNVEPILGFEETNNEDLIVPRLKMINALSPERIDGTATEGHLLNSLTQEDVTDQVFIPVKQFYSGIEWNPDRDDDTRMFCRTSDGRIGVDSEGKSHACITCKKKDFDNSKKGKEAAPLCTTYINFLGLIAGNPMPVVLSFSKTNMSEGKKLLTMAKSMRANMWNYGYKLSGKKVTKGKNTWFNISTSMAGETNEMDRAFALSAYTDIATAFIKTEYEDAGVHESNEDIDTSGAEV